MSLICTVRTEARVRHNVHGEAVGNSEMLDQLTNVSTDPLHDTSGIRYHTTEQSSWHHDISIDSVQVDCSIISSGSAECCRIL